MLKLIGFDIETAGVLPEYALQAYRATRGEAFISAASISVGGTPLGVLKPSVEEIESMLDYAVNQKAHVVGWNTPFDISWLYAVGVSPDLINQVNWLDGMLLWNHLKREPESDKGPRVSYSLETALKEYFPDQAGFKEFKDFQSMDEEDLKKLLHRNKCDAVYTVKLAKLFLERLAPVQTRAALLEARCLPLVALTYVQGITIDLEALQALKKTLLADADTAHAALKAHHPAIDEINLGSPAQLGELLYKTWGLTAVQFTEKGAPSTDKYALHALAETYPQARLLRDYRESQNNLAKYVTAIEESVRYNGDGCSRPQAKIFGTYTGRMTYYSTQKRPKKKP